MMRQDENGTVMQNQTTQPKIAVVCSSNQNRSMEAHHLLAMRGFNVRSFGSGNHVKLPGAAPNQPNSYSFDTTYAVMYEDLRNKNEVLYTHNGILNMLARNRRIKDRPERFQDCREYFNLIITCEERVFDQVCDELVSRDINGGSRPVHVINVDIMDNHEEATIGSHKIREMVQRIAKCEGPTFDDDILDVVKQFKASSGRNVLYAIFLA